MAAGITVAVNDKALASLINSMAGWGAIGARPDTGDVIAGSFYYDTTNSILYQEQNGAWVAVLQTKTLNPANEIVEAGYYAATTLSAIDADLAVGNIKKDVIIFGFTGTMEDLGAAATNAILAMFQAWVAQGTMDNPHFINDNNTANWASANAINEYAEVSFGDLVIIKRWRQFGRDSHNGTGRWKIQYWNVVTDAWVDWVTNIPTRITNDWSDFTTESEVITTKIKLICTTVDSATGFSLMPELEVIF